jgi:hypothetical protein
VCDDKHQQHKQCKKRKEKKEVKISRTIQSAGSSLFVPMTSASHAGASYDFPASVAGAGARPGAEQAAGRSGADGAPLFDAETQRAAPRAAQVARRHVALQCVLFTLSILLPV